MEGNSDAHIKASLMGSSVTLIVSGGSPIFGDVDVVVFCEFDGPRNRPRAGQGDSRVIGLVRGPELLLGDRFVRTASVSEQIIRLRHVLLLELIWSVLSRRPRSR